ncbi:unnamed protein product, partial [Rotaria magnacalcarata]
NDSSATPVHTEKPDEQGNTRTIQNEQHSTHHEDPKASTVNETHQQQEQTVIENANDPHPN